MPDQNDQDKKPGQGIDPKSFLLPKKEGPSVDSAERVNAGALLAQEQAAGIDGPPKPAPVPAPAPAPVQQVAPAAPPKKEESSVKPLETYQGDIESVVNKKSVSVVSIAAAEADRRAQTPLPQGLVQEGMPLSRRLAYIGGGVLLVAIAAGMGVYLYTRPTTVAVVPLATAALFIAVDDTKTVTVAANATQATLMTALDNARKAVSLSLGLVERLYVAVPAADGQTQTEMPVQTFLHTLALNAPPELLRTLQPDYLLGVHSFDENQAFLLLSTDSYETAYAAMLTWEPTMQSDLLPLFTRTLPVHANTDATSTAQTPGVLASTFDDRVVENHDARVIQNQYGDISLLWTFLDRNTIAIATSEFTLREIISRRTSAANLNLPQ